MTGGIVARGMTRVPLLGVSLIVLGMVLLLRRFGVIDLHVREIVWPALGLLGLFLAGRGLADGRRGRIVGGTILFLYSIFFLIRSSDRYSFPFDLIVPATFLIVGIAFAMLFVNRPSEWYYAIPALLLGGIGASIMLTEYGVWFGWELREALRTWWPAALILTGGAMLLRRSRRREREEGAMPDGSPSGGGAGGTS